MTSEPPPGPALTLNTPLDLLAAVPYLLGFHPTRSLVMLGVARTELRIVARWDLPCPPGAFDTFVLSAPREDLTHLLAVGYGPGPLVTPAIDAVRTLTAQANIPVAEALRVADGRFWSYLCDRSACCPVEGTPYDPTTARISAEAAVQGMIALPDRAALQQTLAPHTGPPRLAMHTATAEITAALTTRLATLLTTRFATVPDTDRLTPALLSALSKTTPPKNDSAKPHVPPNSSATPAPKRPPTPDPKLPAPTTSVSALPAALTPTPPSSTAAIIRAIWEDGRRLTPTSSNSAAPTETTTPVETASTATPTPVITPSTPTPTLTPSGSTPAMTSAAPTSAWTPATPTPASAPGLIPATPAHASTPAQSLIHTAPISPTAPSAPRPDALAAFTAEYISEALARIRSTLAATTAKTCLTDHEAAQLGFDLSIIRIRDEAWITMDETHIPLWRDLTRRLEPRFVPPTASLLAMAAWRSGDCVLAAIAVERALTIDPDYSLARLIHYALVHMVSPAAFGDRMPNPSDLDHSMGIPQALWLLPMIALLEEEKP